MTTLTVPEGVRLCTAWADRLARDHDVRALVIKGRVLEAQGLREGYESRDVDLLVDAAAFDRFIDLLEMVGWTPLTASSAPTIIPKHSITISHPHWPMTMDVHHYFPGFLADPQVVFDVLWERHATAGVAEVEVRAPDPAAHAALVALHYLRDPETARSTRELPELIDRARATLTHDQLDDLATVAAQTGSSTTLRPFLDALGVRTVDGANDQQGALSAWRLRTAVPGSAWIVGSLVRIPPWRWPPAIWRAIWLTDPEIAAYHQRGDESLLRARWRRLGRGLRKLPGAIKDLAVYWNRGYR